MPMCRVRLHTAKRVAHRLVLMTAGPLELATSQVHMDQKSMKSLSSVEEVHQRTAMEVLCPAITGVCMP